MLRKIFSHFHVFPLSSCYHKRKGAIVMDNLDLQLEQINQNLNTVIMNQLLIYQKLELLEGKIEKGIVT